ncbi:MAG TPA: cell division protein FtsH, partial [Acidimicrobiales bacterium]|nr:cell division protein FtsH [Acidimicrobiales bacterium]
MLLGRMAVSLGGAVAEELVYGEASTGAWSDLEYVGDLARRMVRIYGMSKELGLLACPDGPDGGRPAPSFSEDSARLIDAEVRALVDEATRLARSVLVRPVLDRVAAALVEHETLSGAKLQELAAGLAAPAANGDRATTRRRATGPV